jgi:hypothetical protein
MCPAHAPDEIQSLGRGGRVHKLRRPKNAKIVDPQLRRGVKNNGVIEIENDPSDGEEEVEDGVIHRVTEKSIKLDFIDRVHRYVQSLAHLNLSLTQSSMRKAEAEHAAALRRDSEHRLKREDAAAARARQAFNARSQLDQSAALSLAALAGADPGFELDGDQVNLLVTELLVGGIFNLFVLTVLTLGRQAHPRRSSASCGRPRTLF